MARWARWVRPARDRRSRLGARELGAVAAAALAMCCAAPRSTVAAELPLGSAADAGSDVVSAVATAEASAPGGRPGNAGAATDRLPLREENRAFCLARAKEPGPSVPCELPRDRGGYPEARADQSVACGHLMTPVCGSKEFCSREVIPGVAPTWKHDARAEVGVERVACYALPPACRGEENVCACVEAAFRGRLHCPRGFFLTCERSGADPSTGGGDLTLECAGIR